MFQRLSAALFQPVDIASLVYFRIVFYAIMLWEAWRFLTGSWVGLYFTDKAFYFTYWPFTFVHPWPGNGLTIHLYVTAAVALCLILGLFYGVSAVLFFLLFSYLFLLEKALYLNHFYFACLVAFLMIFLPAHRDFSLDVWRNPHLRTQTVPAWTLWLLRFQVGVPYFFGGLSKLNADWLQGEPLRTWIAERPNFPLLGPFFTNEAVVWLMTYGSLLLDLCVVFFLLNRRTRVFAYIAALLFHFMNSRLFFIGIFPWMMIAVTAVFFEPDWPRRMLRDLREGHPYRVPACIAGFLLGFCIGGIFPSTFAWLPALVGGLGVAIAAYHLDEPFRSVQRVEEGEAQRLTEQRGSLNRNSAHTDTAVRGTVKSPHPPFAKGGQREARGDFRPQRCVNFVPSDLVPQWALALLGMWVAIQLLLPLRHFFIPGNVYWTEEALNFSWHMMARQKEAEGTFVATDPTTGEQWNVNLWEHLTLHQQREMLPRPHMIVQFVHYLADHLRNAGHKEVEIRARVTVSLNGRTPQLMIDPNVDLAKVPYPWWGHAEWILPLEVPLETAWQKGKNPPVVKKGDGS